MPDLKNRSYKKELLDADNIPFADIRQNMKELNLVNSMLGGHKICIGAIKEIIKNKQADPLTICEIGCGGADNIEAIDKWCRSHQMKRSYIGIDIKDACIGYAKEQYPLLPANWITNDYAAVDLSLNKPAIIFSSLFCHHFREEELVGMLGWMKKNSKNGFFINDLHRHPLAYFLIKWLTRFFSKSYLVKNDAPLSVARGFTKKEWKKLLDDAGIADYRIRWKWAFRYLIVCKNE